MTPHLLLRRPIEQSRVAERRIVALYRRAWLLCRLAVERRLERGKATKRELRRIILAELRGVHAEARLERIAATVLEGLRRQNAKVLGEKVPRSGLEVLVKRWMAESMEALRSLLVGEAERSDDRKAGSPLSLLELTTRALSSASDAKAAADRVAQATRGAWRRAASSARMSVLNLAGRANKAIQTGLGVRMYRWETQRDDRVRREHRARQGRIFSWSDPPDGGHPGEAPNCRCIAIPIRA